MKGIASRIGHFLGWFAQRSGFVRRVLSAMLDSLDAPLLRPVLMARGGSIVRRALLDDETTTLRGLLDRNHGQKWDELLESDGRRAFRRFAVKHEGEPVREVLADERHQVILEQFLRNEGAAHFHAFVRGKGIGLLRTALWEDEDALLADVLCERKGAALRRLLFRDNYRLFREMAKADRKIPLKAALFADDDLLLKSVLSEGNCTALRRVLFADEYRLFMAVAPLERRNPLKAALFANNDALLRSVLREENCTALRRVLFSDEYRLFMAMAPLERRNPLKAALFADDDVLLKSVLRDEGYAALRRVLFADNYRLFGEVAALDRKEPLRACLFAEDDALLRALLCEDGFAALRRVAFRDDHRLFSVLAGLERLVPLKAALLANDSRLFAAVLRDRSLFPPLRGILSADEDEMLRRLLTCEDRAALDRVLSWNDQHLLLCHLRRNRHEALRRLMAEGRGQVLKDFLEVRKGWALRELLVTYGVVDCLLDNEGLAGVLSLAETWREVRPVFGLAKSEEDERLGQAKTAIRSPKHVATHIIDAVTDGDLVRLAGGSLQYREKHAFWTLVQELLVDEGYFFASQTDRPFILDCGAHYGVSIYFFKRLFPNAQIVAFEPVPELRELALENVRRNGFTDVEILPYCLAEHAGTHTFYVSDTYSMAGSLVDRRKEMGDAVRQIEVECRPLSAFIDRHVDFLKLDIEGPECEVLEEAESALGRVDHVFCEFHQGGGLPSARLPRLLGVLSRSGFEYQVGKSRNFDRASHYRPMTYVTQPASMVIWGKRRSLANKVKVPEADFDGGKSE